MDDITYKEIKFIEDGKSIIGTVIPPRCGTFLYVLDEEGNTKMVEQRNVILLEEENA